MDRDIFDNIWHIRWQIMVPHKSNTSFYFCVWGYWFHFRLTATIVIVTLDGTYQRVRPPNIAYNVTVPKSKPICNNYSVEIEVSLSFVAGTKFNSFHNFSHLSTLICPLSSYQVFPENLFYSNGKDVPRYPITRTFVFVLMEASYGP